MDDYEIRDIKSTILFLKDRRNNVNFSYNDISNNTGCSYMTFMRMESGENIPKLDNFLAYIYKLGYTFYVVHETGTPVFTCDSIDEYYSLIIENLRNYRLQLMKTEKFVSLGNIALNTKISHTTFMRMENGNVVPRMDNFLAYINSLGFVAKFCYKDNKIYKSNR